MANEARQAVKDLRNLGSFVRGLMALEEALGPAVDLEKLIQSKREELSVIEGKASGAQGIVDAALKRADVIVSDANKKAQEAEGKRVAADAAADAARADARRITTEAGSEAQALLDKTKAEAEALRRQAIDDEAVILKSIAAKRAELADLNEQADAAVARKAEAEAEIARLKRVFGGK